jgi:hypothetical protein
MDKRRHPRFIKRLTATFFVDHQRSRGISSDLSESGLFIRTTRGLAANTTISIELLLPNNKVSLLKGIVRRTVRTSISSIKNGMGIEITDKDSAFTDFMKSITGESKANITGKDDISDLQAISFSMRNTRQKESEDKTRERRRHKRLRVEHLRIDSKMPPADGVRILNISLSGILLKTCSRLKIGRKYAVRIGYANRVVLAKADVVWSLLLESLEGARGDIKPLYLAGMQFANVSDKEIEEIVNLIKSDAREIASVHKAVPAELMREMPAYRGTGGGQTIKCSYSEEPASARSYPVHC